MLIFVCSLTICCTDYNYIVTQNYENGKIIRNIKQIDNVSMSIKEGTLSSLGATIIIEDNSDNNNVYGEHYWIEIDNNGLCSELNVISDGSVYPLVPHFVSEDGTIQFNIVWKYKYGELKSGNYRLIMGLNRDEYIAYK